MLHSIDILNSSSKKPLKNSVPSFFSGSQLIFNLLQVQFTIVFWAECMLRSSLQYCRIFIKFVIRRVLWEKWSVFSLLQFWLKKWEWKMINSLCEVSIISIGKSFVSFSTCSVYNLYCVKWLFWDLLHHLYAMRVEKNRKAFAYDY